jgi:peptidoglycan/LPS O-acetylase OafA/YrhL
MASDETKKIAPPPQAQAASSHILSLDLCRGLAAFVVMTYHISFLLFDNWTIFQRGYLCVDFFFILSGYVIASSYDAKISNGLSVRRFFVIRTARLWPLVVLTTLIAFVVQTVRLRRDIPDISNLDLAVSLVSNIFMMPSPQSPIGVLFPFNGSAWSIFFEMVANLAYVAAFRHLSETTLKLLIVVSGLALAWTAFSFNSLDVGMTQTNFIFGFPRVAFSFFLGVMLCRRRDYPLRIGTRGDSGFLYLALLAAGAIICLPKVPLAHVDGLIDFAVAVCVFPIILRIAETTKLSGRLGTLAWFLGGISYSVYLLQTPLMVGYSALPQLFFGAKVAQFVPWSGIVFILFMLPTSYLCWVYFERPAQRWLLTKLLNNKGRLASIQQSRP